MCRPVSVESPLIYLASILRRSTLPLTPRASITTTPKTVEVRPDPIRNSFNTKVQLAPSYTWLSPTHKLVVITTIPITIAAKPPAI